MNESKYLYVVFTRTPYKLGIFIRIFIRNWYNHVSVTLDSDLKSFYTFARYHENTAFYGGFIEESVNRFRNKGHVAVIKVCQVPITQEQETRIQNYFAHLCENRRTYIYNYISAIFTPWRIKIRIPRAYTCAEFGVSVLCKANVVPTMDEKKFYAIRELETLFKDNVIYEGPLLDDHFTQDWGNDLFDKRQGRVFHVRRMVLAYVRLFRRWVKGGI